MSIIIRQIQKEKCDHLKYNDDDNNQNNNSVEDSESGDEPIEK